GGGSTVIRNSKVGFLDGQGANVTVEGAEIPYVSGVYADFTITACTLKNLTLSYSRASVQGSRFAGSPTYVGFHGPSGGTFERNAFLAPETVIEVRHNSTPSFHSNDFLSPSTQVVCETYQLSTCVSMEQNWWGTADESRIRTRFAAGCPVCYAP